MSRRRFILAFIALSLAGATATVAQAQVVTSGAPSCPGVALTFDLCPVRQGAGFDQGLIDYLIEHKIPATFFISGKWIVKHDEHMKALLAVPFFEVGTHGEAHAHLPMHPPGEQKEEIVGPVRLIKRRYHREATLFRPPYGEYDDATIEVVKALGLKFILWNVVSGDPDPTLSAEQIVGRLTHTTRKGSIIVMHANGKGKHTREVVTRLYEDLLPQRHLTAMTVSEVLACRKTAP